MIRTKINAGVCGFKTTVLARSDDMQNVTLSIETDCEKIRGIAEGLSAPIDAYQEINPKGESVLMRTVRSSLTGCCAGCAVPVGLFKAMQVAAGLALPRDIAIRLTKE